MKKYDFNENWFCRDIDEEEAHSIKIPHDAMRTERRSLSSLGKHNIGWFECHDYVYTKNFMISKDYKNNSFILEFEGIYHDAEVYLNGKKVAYRPYGYTNFFVNISSYIKFDEDNEIRVIAKNSDQPNSRWYSGTGIYRPVWMYMGEEKYITVNGIKIRTVSIDSAHKNASVEIITETSTEGNVAIEIRNQRNEQTIKTEIKCEQYNGENKYTGSGVIKIENADLWNTDNPVIYTCEAVFGEDRVSEHFGIRLIEWNEENGFLINGERTILKGACIHHDNGVLGACTYPEAEERKVRILKENGYNAIRSAHNPCSKALLDACDKLGMLVMDEYVDMWYIHKNQYDYASHMDKWWEQDLKDMVEKDYNHPSVILYSTGNEVAETGQKRGIELTGQMTQYLHSLDQTRPVSCGINIFFNFLYAMGFGVYSDEKAKKESQKASNKKVGSEFYNMLAGMLGDKAMKIGAMLPMCDVKTRDAYANMDIAGYNYGIYRYKHDLKKYPKRLILGSETFCKDAYSFYELAKKEKRIVGDFVWAGMDYIGEAGIGSWEYEDYASQETEDAGWLTAGSGRINILGYPIGEALYTKVALGQENGPFIAVRPVYQNGKHTPSAWKMTDALESWSWKGCDGKQAVVEVYARATEVELWLNEKRIAKKKLANSCSAVFKIPYEDGTIRVISYDKLGNEIGRCEKKTASVKTVLSMIPEKEQTIAKKIQFIQLRYTDEMGIWKPMEKHQIKIKVENGELMGFGNACPYNKDGYCRDEIQTYYGEALAAVRAGESGKLKVVVTDEKEEHSLELQIKE